MDEENECHKQVITDLASKEFPDLPLEILGWIRFRCSL